MKYFAIEGGVCSGKTTTIQALERCFGITVLPEYMELLPTDHPTRSYTLLPDERIEIFLQLDQKRSALPPYSTREVVGDRSLLSIIAFEYAFTRLGLASDLQKFIQFDSTNRLPDAVFYLDVDPKLREKRWLDRFGNLDSIFVNREFNQEFQRFFQILAKLIRTAFVETSEGMDTRKLVSAALDFFYEISPGVPSVTIGEIIHTAERGL